MILHLIIAIRLCQYLLDTALDHSHKAVPVSFDTALGHSHKAIPASVVTLIRTDASVRE